MHGEAPDKSKRGRLNGLRSAAELSADKPHGTRIKYLGGCRCIPCRAANSRYNSECDARKREGLGNGLVDTAPALEHLRILSGQGVGYKAVCEAAGVGNSSVMLAMQGRRKLMRAANARAILAVTFDMAVRDGALVSAKPTWRHIRWLMNEGMTKTEIARRLGSKAKTPTLQIRPNLVLASTAMKIEKLVGMMKLGE
jgi:hypothetical protein